MDTSFSVIKPLSTTAVGTHKAQVAFCLFDKPYLKYVVFWECARGWWQLQLRSKECYVFRKSFSVCLNIIFSLSSSLLYTLPRAVSSSESNIFKLLKLGIDGQ